MKNYNYVFVLPDLFPTKYPSGGANIIYRLASHLASMDYKVAILSIKTRKASILARIMFPNNYILRAFESFRNSDYDYSLLKKVDIVFEGAYGVPSFKAEHIFSCAYQTAFFVSDYKTNHPSTKAYSIIQNDEASPLFSGNSSSLARVAYDYQNLKKIVISNALAKIYKKDKPLVFQDAIDDIFKLQSNYLGRKPIILFPLRREESKGSLYMTEAFYTLRKELPNWRFVAYGNMDKTYVESANIEYHYKPTNEELVKLYNQAMIFVCSSLIEGFALPVCEAMACGDAVVTTNNLGISDFCKHKSNAIIVPIKNPSAIVEGVKLLTSNSVFRHTIASKGILAAKNYTYENMYISFDKIMGIKNVKQ